MPILKHNRAHYPVNWAELSLLIREANLWTCQECNEPCRRPNDAESAGRQKLTVAHYDNEYDAPQVFLACICARCHLQHDAPFRPQARERNLRIVRHEAGQLEIFQEERVAE